MWMSVSHLIVIKNSRLSKQAQRIASLSCAHWANLFFEDTWVQLILFIILLVVLIMIMRYYGFDDMLFCFIYIDRCYWLGSPRCAGLWTLSIQRHRWNPLDSRSTEWTIGFEFCRCDICTYHYILRWLITIVDKIRWWM